MISANAHIHPPQQPDPSNGYIVKPLRIRELLRLLQQTCQLTWQYQNDAEAAVQNTIPEPPSETENNALDIESRHELLALAQIGYINAIRLKLDALRDRHHAEPSCLKELDSLSELTNSFKLSQLTKRLEDSE
jgi:hypothetical protein